MVIAVTQRVDVYGTYRETRNALDIKWSKFFNTHNLTSISLSNDLTEVKRTLASVQVSGMILTGGNDVIKTHANSSYSKERSDVENFLLQYSKMHKLPVLGICRGFQMLNIFLDGRVHEINGHIGTSHDVDIPDNQFCSSTKIEVNSYHGYGIKTEDLSPAMIPFAYDFDGNVEAAIHKRLKWLGVMWHPERDLLDLDTQIIKFLFKNA
jgi:N5-(cytidine 5'-diphosphoramidyl)-L-glutamine hydrolase